MSAGLLAFAHTMSLTQTDLRQIATGALTLDERLALPDTAFVADPGAVQRRLDHWRRSLGEDFPDRLGKRLAQLDLSEARAAMLMGGLRPDALTVLPDWTRALADLAPAFALDIPVPADLAEIPFADLLWPLARLAGTRIMTRHPDLAALLTDQAQEDIDAALLRILSTVTAHSLFAEFDLWRRLRRGGDPYGSFVRHFRAAGHVAFLREYPVLARRIVTFVESHIRTTAQFLTRLAADTKALAAAGDLPVARLNIGLSDRHDGGATVILVDFASGRKLVYKPKPIEPEIWFNDFAHAAGTLANIPGGLVRPGLLALARDGYGWVGYIEHLTCTAPDQVERYYRRAGGLAALVHLINGYDFHEENVIASGEWPTLVDFETLFNPEPLRPDGQDRPQWSVFSVMDTMLLTAWMPSAQGGSVDIGGFTGCLDDVAQHKAQYLDPNSATMRWGIMPKPPRRGSNLVRLGDQPQRLADHLAPFRDGFSRVFRAVRDKAGTGLDALIARAETLEFRHILRHTRIYVTLLEASYHPDLNRDGIALSLHYEQVMRVTFLGSWKRDQADFARQEQAELMAEDVPVFTRRNDGRDLLSVTGAAVRGFFGNSGIDAFRRHLALTSEDELWRQIELVNAAVFAAGATPATLRAGVEGDAFAPVAEAARSDDMLTERAAQIGRDLIRRAFVAPNGGLNWQGAVPSDAHRRYQVGGLDQGVYAGNGGIALFLAVLDRALPGQGFADAARATVSMAPEDFGRPEDVATFRVPIGGYSGAGALIYANVRLAALLDDPAPLGAALRLAGLLSPVHIHMDTQFDVLNGSAGLILALLDLAQASGEPRCLTLAEVAGDHLLAHAVAQGDTLAWPTIEGLLHGGFAHGAAGIAVALIRLGHRLGRDDFVRAGHAALGFQARLWDAAQTNWRDTRREDGACSCQWCYGAAGTGFAYLALSGLLPDATTREGTDRAARAVSGASAALVDHLCCGNAGSVMLLMRAGQPKAARPMAVGLATARATPGDFVLYPRGTYAPPLRQPVFPGLMQGTAGIGLTLLSVARPDLPIPDVMTLSAPNRRHAA